MSDPRGDEEFDRLILGATPVGRDPVRVGQPTHELMLLSALSLDARHLFKPGPGRVTFLLPEPEIGMGRPDALVLTLSANGLRSFREKALRLPSYAAARALDEETDDADVGVSVSYVKTLRRELSKSGWTQAEFKKASRLVADSIAIEAKIDNGRRAIEQVVKFSPRANRSAVLMPLSKVQNLPSDVLRNYGVGVIAESAGRLAWTRPADFRPLKGWQRAWLAELLVRGLSDGSAYSFSVDRKIRSASSKATTLGR